MRKWVFLVVLFSTLTCLLFSEPSFLSHQDLRDFFDVQQKYYLYQGLDDSKGVETNDLIICHHSLEMYEWDLELLNHATQSIEISGSFCGGEGFRNFLMIIDQRMEIISDLQTHILSSDLVLEEEDKNLVKALKRKYPERFHFQLTTAEVRLLPELMAMENHLKMVVVDEAYFSTGSTNLDQRLMSDGLPSSPILKKKSSLINQCAASMGQKDTNIIGKGPLAKKLRLEFYKHFTLWEHYFFQKKMIKDPECFYEINRYFPLKDSPIFIEKFEICPQKIQNVPIHIYFSGPHQKENIITKIYEDNLDNAQKRIVIGNLYFHPAGHILTKLHAAIRRNVICVLVTNGLYEDSPWGCTITAWANRLNYLPLFYGKNYSFWEQKKCCRDLVYPTEIYEYHQPDVTYHCKIMLIDDQRCLIGSYNLGHRSHYCDYELVLTIDSKEVVCEFLKGFEIEKTRSERISVEQAKDWYFDPFVDFVGKNQQKIHNIM